MQVANRIRIAREKAELTQKQLAKRLRLGQSAISQWESGATKPDIQNRVKLSVVLRIPFSELFPESEQISQALMSDPRALQLLQHFVQLPPEQQEAMLVAVASLAEKQRTPVD